VEEATAKEVSIFILEEIICRHGCPKRILSDRESHFNNEMIRELTEKFKVKHGFSSPYHPKTNGLVERFNKTLCESLAKLKEDKRNITTENIKQRKVMKLEIKYYTIKPPKKRHGQENWKKNGKDHTIFMK